MGTEIVVITFANLLVLGYSILLRIIRFVLVESGYISQDLGAVYKYHAMFVLFLALLPSLSFLWFISADYDLAIGYILIIQSPIILLTLRTIMSFGAWKNLTRRLRTDC